MIVDWEVSEEIVKPQQYEEINNKIIFEGTKITWC